MRRCGGRQRARFDRGQLQHIVVLQEVAQNRCGIRFAVDRIGEHHAGGSETVAFDDAWQHRLEVFGRRVFGVVTELLDAILVALACQEEHDAFEGAVETTARCGVTKMNRIEFARNDALQSLEWLFVEAGNQGCEFGVGGERKRAVEESEGLQTGLHLIHDLEATGRWPMGEVR